MNQVRQWIAMGERACSQDKAEEALGSRWKCGTRQMSQYGAMLRSFREMKEMSREIEEELKKIMEEDVKEPEAGPGQLADHRAFRLSRFYRYLDMRLCQKVYLDAMTDYREEQIQIPELAVFSLDGPGGRAHGQEVQEIWYEAGSFQTQARWRRVRPLDEVMEDQAFEVVWKSYREGETYR